MAEGGGQGKREEGARKEGRELIIAPVSSQWSSVRVRSEAKRGKGKRWKKGQVGERRMSDGKMREVK